MEYTSKWYEQDQEEIKRISFLWASDTVSKDEPMDFTSWFCGIFSLSCLIIVGYFGISRELTLPMVYLMLVYVLIAIFSLCRPVQVKISSLLWNCGFRNRIAVNKGYDPVVRVEEDKVTVTGNKGEEVYTINEDCFFIQSRNFVILHITDKKLFAVLKEELSEEGILEGILSLCVNLSEKESEGQTEEAESITVEEENTEVSETEDTAEEDALEAAENEAEAEEQGLGADEAEEQGLGAAEAEEVPAENISGTGSYEKTETADADEKKNVGTEN